MTILNFPTGSTTAFGPVEDYTITLNIVGNEVGGIGANVGDKLNGITPLAGIVEILACCLNSGIVDSIGSETRYSATGKITG